MQEIRTETNEGEKVNKIELERLFLSPTAEPHPNMVNGVGDFVQLVNYEGERMPDIGIVVQQSAHDNDMWLVEWTNCDTDHDGYAIGEMYDTWVETGDLWVIR